MKKIFLIAIVTLSISIKAQTIQWAKQFSGTGNDVSMGIAVDASGNVYTTGFFQGTVDFDPGVGVSNLSSAGGNDIYISKQDALGNFVWVKRIGDTGDQKAMALDIDISGNILVTGWFNNTVDFDPGVTVLNLSPTGFSDAAFILKLDAAGNFIWAKSIGGTGGEWGQGIKSDLSGNVCLTGHYMGIVDFDPGVGTSTLVTVGGSTDADIFILKLDINGNFVWAKSMGGVATDFGEAIDIDATGNIYTTGTFYNSVDFDPTAGVFTITSNGNQDIFISKLDATGNFVWAKGIGGTLGDGGNAIDLDASGNVYTTGSFYDIVDFNPGAGTYSLTSNGLGDMFISILDAAGNFISATSIGGTSTDNGIGITVDPTGNIFTTGTFDAVVDFDPGVGTFYLSGSGNEVFISKLNSSGNFSSAISFGSSGVDIGRKIISDTQGNIYTTGFFSSTVDFDPGPGTNDLTSGGGLDIYVIKMASCSTVPTQPGAINGLTSICAGSSASTYSVPSVSGATSYNWSLPGGWSGASTINTISATAGFSGTFSVTATNACGTSSAQTLSVTVNSLPTVTVNSGSICTGNSFTINPTGASTYTITGGSAIVNPTGNASYSVTGTSAAGCASSNTAVSNVTVNTLPTINASTTNTLMCTGESVTLTGNGASTYTWNPGGTGTSISVSPTTTSTYTLNGTDANGCVNSSIFTQSVSLCTGIVTSGVVEKNEILIYPNPFNDKVIVSLNDSKKVIQVFNSLGSMIYDSTIENEFIKIDLSDHSSGIYFIRIGLITKKIIKE